MTSIEEQMRGMAAVQSAVTNEPVETVLARMNAFMDREAAQRRAWEAEADRRAAEAKTTRRASDAPVAAPAPAAPSVPVSPPRPALPTDRGAAIDAATLPGCEQLAANLKADLTISAPDAALLIAARYRELRGLPASPVSRSTAGAVEQTPEGWKAEYAASKELQREHGSAAAYANYMQGVADGRVRVYGGAGVIPRRVVSTAGAR